MKPANEVREKIERLVDRLVEQRVVPFLGAGVSKDATCNNKKVANTDNLIRNVSASIQKMQNAKEKNLRCYDLREKTLDRLCEIYLWLNQDMESLVKDVLHIDEFTKLNPTPAHRYIAFLAREELLDEVITTNYDTCLEKAYCDTFKCMEPRTDENTPARVVTCLNDYRENAGMVYVSKERTQRCLKIYKVNGCAKNFVESISGGNSNAETILLTESQLQNWRQRHWARDLFCDRLRSRTIVFSGFGSDEPQVRHTVLQVVEEFQDRREPSENKWYNLPNAPFIAAYEKSLSFSQVQIFNAFIKAHNMSFTFDEVHHNAFTGNDGAFFGCNEQGLTADIFWKRIFQVTFWRILEKYCTRDSSAFNYLSSVVPPAEALIQEMLDWIAPRDRPFGRFPEMLDVEKGNNCIPLALWVWGVRFRQTMPENGGWYAPLKERPVLIPILLLILYLVAEEEACLWGKLSNLVSIKKEFFRIKMSKDGFNVFIAHQQKAFQDQEAVDLPEDFNQSVLVQVVISNSSMEIAQRKRIKNYKKKEPSDDGIHGVCMVSVYQIPVRELFRSEITWPYSITRARKVFRESLHQAFLTIDRARPRLRHRAKPI